MGRPRKDQSVNKPSELKSAEVAENNELPSNFTRTAIGNYLASDGFWYHVEIKFDPTNGEVDEMKATKCGSKIEIVEKFKIAAITLGIVV